MGRYLRRLRAPAVAAGIVLAAAAAGCASYGSRMGPVLESFRRREFDRAVERLDKSPDPESVLWLAERGLLLRHAGRLEESNQAFLAARDREEELYTRSVSNEAVALAVSDALRPYRPPGFEVPFLYVYPALNYLELGRTEDAVVEARALSAFLEGRRDETDGGGDWGLGRLLAGWIFEAAGNSNDARVAYRSAEEAWSADGARSGAAALAAEGRERIERRLGLVSGPGAPDPGGGEPAPAAGGEQPAEGGRVVVWVERGWVPPLEDVHLRVPILRSEEGWGEDRIAAWSSAAGDRAVRIRRGESCCGAAEIAYLLDVALPALPDPLPVGTRLAVRVAGAPAAPLLAADDIDAAARNDLERRYPSIAARAAARAILKALATRTARKESGEVAGTVVNLLGVATERADTRSWSTLPSWIGVAVIEAPAGPVEVRISPSGSGDRTEAEGRMELRAGGWHFFSARLLP